MTSSLKYMPVLAGMLALAGWAGTAEAQTVVNLGGASAARGFMSEVPQQLCTNPAVGGIATSTARAYFNGAALHSSNQSAVSCTLQGQGNPTWIIRYSATGSSDGVNKLLQPPANAVSNMAFLNHATCPTHNPGLNPCPAGALVQAPVHMGASDVQGSSFGQTGPIGTTVLPLPDGGLNSQAGAVTPFTVFLGRGVVRLNAAGTAPAGPVQNLSRLEIEQLFARGVTDWRSLGFGTVTDAAPGTLEATSPIVACFRSAGSGTKAAFDQTVMINANEAVLPGAQAVFSPSSSGGVTCLANNRRSIGYMDADQVTNFLPGGPHNGLAYAVRVDGGLANDSSLTDPKRDLKCGKYAYWTTQRLNRRNTPIGGGVDALMQRFVDAVQLESVVSALPVTGDYWSSTSAMAVTKNVDKGPLNWKPGVHPGCR